LVAPSFEKKPPPESAKDSVRYPRKLAVIMHRMLAGTMDQVRPLSGSWQQTTLTLDWPTYRNGFERPTSRAPGFPAILAVIR
jgi:hypothetical protein